MYEVLRDRSQTLGNELREGEREGSLAMYRLNTPRFPPLGWTAGRWIEMEDDNEEKEDDKEEE